MSEIKIPESLRPQFDRIVKTLYEGDEQKALQAAVEIFIKQEIKRLPSGEKFEDILSKRLVVESDKTGYSDKQISGALQKLQERKKRLGSLDFGSANEEEKNKDKK